VTPDAAAAGGGGGALFAIRTTQACATERVKLKSRDSILQIPVRRREKMDLAPKTASIPFTFFDDRISLECLGSLILD